MREIINSQGSSGNQSYYIDPVPLPSESESPQSEQSRTSNQITVNPTVFRIPETGIENDLISIMMPFDKSFNSVFIKIESICKDHNLQCKRADQVHINSEIMQDVFSLIYQSKIVVCDFTEQKPNVFYEAGIAHTLGRPVIPIANEEIMDIEKIPFDLAHHRCITYSSGLDKLKYFSQKLSERISTILKK